MFALASRRFASRGLTAVRPQMAAASSIAKTCTPWCSCPGCGAKRSFSTVKSEVEAANAKYVAEFADGDKALPPARGFAVLTCMDARLMPGDFAGLALGDAHVIRNAGGRASDDAIRSLVISHKLLGTNTYFVVHHTDCGMVLFNDDVMGGLLEQSLETATPSSLDPATIKWTDSGKGPGCCEGKYTKWLTFSDEEKAVVEDVERIRKSPMVNPKIPIFGYIYDVRSGKMIEVKAASEAGKAQK